MSVLLVLSGFFFYRAYDLWSEFQRIIVMPEIVAIIPKVTIIETYYQYFPLYSLYGLVLLTCAIIVLVLQTKLIYIEESKPLPQLRLRRKHPALWIAGLGLLVVSTLFFYGAYDLWSRYQSSSETWHILMPHIDYRNIDKTKIETYEKLFLPYLIGGVGTIILASNIIVLSIRKQKPSTSLKNLSSFNGKIGLEIP